MWPLIHLFALILLPLVPAYLLFRALPTTKSRTQTSSKPVEESSSESIDAPSSGIVEGTLFAGMEIKLGGSFAGYFAVVCLLLVYHDTWNPPPPPAPVPQAYVWHLSGQITDDNGQPIEGLEQAEFEFSPLTFQKLAGGHFSLTIPTEPQQGGGTQYPTVVIHHQDQLRHEDYLPLEIPINPTNLDPNIVANFGVSIDESHKLLRMQHIHLKKAPPYDPAHPTTKLEKPKSTGRIRPVAKVAGKNQ